MIFNTRIDFEKDATGIASLNHLQLCTEGKQTFYQSSAYGNFEGVYMKVRGNTVQIKCSIHKLYHKESSGSLDNSQMFTVSNALETIDVLFDRLGIDKNETKVTYYEIGLNIPVEYDPLEYISLVQSIGENEDKEMFNDANFQKNRQKTTEKSRNIKKVLKIYDKGFEARDKDRCVKGNILRIETIYRRQDIPLSVFMSESHISKTTKRFYNDWNSIRYHKRIEAEKGVKSSQIEKARCIMELGREAYLKQSRESFLSGALTKMQWETIRAFIKNWDSMKSKFRYLPDNKEVEYRNMLNKTFEKALKQDA